MKKKNKYLTLLIFHSLQQESLIKRKAPSTSDFVTVVTSSVVVMWEREGLGWPGVDKGCQAETDISENAQHSGCSKQWRLFKLVREQISRALVQKEYEWGE